MLDGVVFVGLFWFGWVFFVWVGVLVGLRACGGSVVCLDVFCWFVLIVLGF